MVADNRLDDARKKITKLVLLKLLSYLNYVSSHAKFFLPFSNFQH